MLHALADRAVANEKLLQLVSQIRKGPFHPLPEPAIKKLTATIFGRTYLGNLDEAKAIFHTKKLPFDQVETAHQLIRGGFFCSWLPGDFDEKIREDSAQASMYVQLHTLVLRVLDQISDDQKNNTSDALMSVDELAIITWTYWMHRAVVAFLSGLWILQEQNDGIYFEPTAAYSAALRRSVFSSTWDMLARQTFEDIIYQGLMEATRGRIKELKSLSLVPPALIDELAWEVLDRFYFLNRRFISLGHNPLMPDALEVAKWLIAAEIAKIFQAKLLAAPEYARQLGLNWSTLEKMIAHTKDNAILDRGLLLDEHIHFGSTSFEHLCNVYHDLVASQQDEKIGGAKVREKVGDWFEKIYVLGLLKESDVSQDYVLLPGHESKDPQNKFDYDGILYNKHTTEIIFLQIKYRLRRTQYYWKDNFREFFGEVNKDLKLSESPFWKAIRQLKGVRNAVNMGALVQEQITTEFRRLKMTPPKLSAENCRFVVLHTAPAFDFVETDGIVMYEFNTFRNLIRRGILGFEISRSGSVSSHKLGRMLPLDQPDSLIDTLCTELDGKNRGINNAHHWHQGLQVTTRMRFAMYYTEPRFKIFGKSFGRECKPIWMPLT